MDALAAPDPALKCFHKRVMQHITGCHVQRDAAGNWSYPDHEDLGEKCGFWPMVEYIKQRQGTLQKYSEEFKPDLLWEVSGLQPPPQDVHYVLWWQQLLIMRDGVCHEP